MQFDVALQGLPTHHVIKAPGTADTMRLKLYLMLLLVRYRDEFVQVAGYRHTIASGHITKGHVMTCVSRAAIMTHADSIRC